MARPRDPDAAVDHAVDPAAGQSGPWRPATRRAFVAALGAAAAALAIRGGAHRWIADDHAGEDDLPPSRWTGTTRWIGHC